MQILAVILTGGYGLLLVLKPGWMWKASERWKSDGAQEPSDRYLKWQRITGCFFILVSLACAILPLE